jgi:hypothetical protein
MVRLIAGLAALSGGGEVRGEGIRRAVSQLGVPPSLLGNTAVAHNRGGGTRPRRDPLPPRARRPRRREHRRHDRALHRAERGHHRARQAAAPRRDLASPSPPGKRAKSRSQDTMSAPCSSARAARWASLVRLPAVPVSRRSPRSKVTCRGVGLGDHGGRSREPRLDLARCFVGGHRSGEEGWARSDADEGQQRNPR